MNAALEKAQMEQKNFMDIKSFKDINEVVVYGDEGEMIRVCEAEQDKKIMLLAMDIAASDKHLVLIAGPSSSGKTTFAKKLCTQLWLCGKLPFYMGTDDYFKEREDIPVGPDGQRNFENLDAMDLDLFNSQMNDMLAGKEVDVPRFDFISGKKEFGAKKVKLQPYQIVVIEGIHALNPAMSAQIPDEEKFKIYIAPFTKLEIENGEYADINDYRKIRRTVRDAARRNYDAKTTIGMWPKVRDGEEHNIFPYIGNADVIFNTYMIYEMAALKKYAIPLFLEIPEGDEDFEEARRLIRLMTYVDELDDDSVIPSTSIIREFIGGSSIDK